jgi:hypothetical protein
MINASIRHAVEQFHSIKTELAAAQAAVGGTVTALVRQHWHDTERGWSLFDMGLDGEVFWGRFVDVDPKGRHRNVLIVFDGSTIDSIEVETYDPIPTPKPAK